MDGGRFWTINEINDNLGNGTFTPNFENEYNTILKPFYEDIEFLV